jgi:hypothetical protein
MLYSKGTEFQRFRVDHRSVQSADNEVIKYLNFRTPFLVKYISFCFLHGLCLVPHHELFTN